MYQDENTISKAIVTPDGETDFQIRYIREENVGIVCTPTNRSYFLLDSADYWYDLIQEKYPPVMKCSCKNDRFNLMLHYTPRVGTEDFKEIRIDCSCTACGKSKRIPTVKIDYSPSAQLLTHPITPCKQPKIKYKTYSLAGYWSNDQLLGMAEYFLKKDLLVYCWYWDSQNTERHFREVSAAELRAFLAGERENYLAIYFSEKSLDSMPMHSGADGKGVVIQQDLWRKNAVVVLHGPFMVMSYGMLHHMDFCSEYLDKDGNVLLKSPSFCAMIQDFRKYSKELLAT